jgi:hypothetical protein
MNPHIYNAIFTILQYINYFSNQALITDPQKSYKLENKLQQKPHMKRSKTDQLNSLSYIHFILIL